MKGIRPMGPARRWQVWLLFIGVALLGALYDLPTTYADSPWSTPTLLYETTTTVSYPVVVADREGTVHVFFASSEARDSDPQAASAIIYMRLYGGVWSEPTDILVPPEGSSLSSLAATVDNSGYLHITFQGSWSSQIYHSRAHVAEATSAHSWSVPQPLTEAGGFRSDILATSDGALHLVYSGREGNIYYRQSTDGGVTWKARVTVSGVAGTLTAADYPRLAADEQGRLHVTWTQFKLPTGWPPEYAMYSRSTDRGETWSTPYEVAGENYGLISVAAVGANIVHLFWHSVVGLSERKHQWSGTDGETWNSPQKIQDIGGGFTGISPMVVDSKGMLHVVTAVNSRHGKTEDVYHLTWDGTTWSPPQYLSTNAVGRRSIELPSLALSEGNRLHVVYEDDFNRIWYTSQVADAPALPAQALPTPTPLPTATPLASTPVPSPTAPPRPTRSVDEQDDGANLTTPPPVFLIGVLPPFLLIGLILAARFVYLSRR